MTYANFMVLLFLLQLALSVPLPLSYNLSLLTPLLPFERCSRYISHHLSGEERIFGRYLHM
uniref:Uncharacterized protein n=1 Tax=Parascaris univalens TaxID=6257 RepID=A0A914ZKW3_PARUN